MTTVYSARRSKGTPHKDFFSDVLRRDGVKVVDAAMKNSVVYLAVQSPQYEGVSALIAPIRWMPKRYDNFAYHFEDETLGPWQSDCPQRILDALSPLEDLYKPGTPGFTHAAQWRKRCWAKIFARRRNPTIRKGNVVKFPKPLVFSGDLEGDTFEFEAGSKFRMKVDQEWIRVRIPNWRDREFEVFEQGEKASSN